MAIKRDEVLQGGVAVPNAYLVLNQYTVDHLNGTVVGNYVAWRDDGTRADFKAATTVAKKSAKEEQDAANARSVAEDRKSRAQAEVLRTEAEIAKEDAIEDMNVNGPMQLVKQVQFQLADIADEQGNVGRIAIYEATMAHPDWAGSVAA